MERKTTAENGREVMKALHKILFIAVAAMFLTTQAKAVLYWGRPYDPNLQRWIQRDPIGEEGGINLYGYVRNNSIRFVDPLGLQLLQLDGIIDTAGEMSSEMAPRPVGVPPPRIPDVSYPKNGPFPPAGTYEHPDRLGKFGFDDPLTGKFRECWRFDKADPNNTGWRQFQPDHFHYWEDGDHMENPPPFQWFSVPPVMNNENSPSIFPAPLAPTAPPPTSPPVRIPPIQWA
jgi:RHS repeat-associated protein